MTATQTTGLLQRAAGDRDVLSSVRVVPGETPTHIWEANHILAVEMGLATGRALLVRGAPGTGKTQLAKAAAHALGAALVPYTVDAHTEPRDLKYHVDHVARLARAQAMAAMAPQSVSREGAPASSSGRDPLEPSQFVHPGPLWWGFNPVSAREQAQNTGLDPKGCAVPPGAEAGGRVLLLDEIDKADPTVPNSLLDALGYDVFDVPIPGCPPRVERAEGRLLVVITTNEERSLPDAFLRRCLVLELEPPSSVDELVERGAAHFAALALPILEEAAHQLMADQAEARRQGSYVPGLAEYLDLLRALVSMCGEDDTRQRALLEQAARFVFRKERRGARGATR
ncbi:MAG: AAA family ATPase [Myxococcota bacterium]